MPAGEEVSAIWHDHGMPSFLGIAPSYSFFDVAEIVEREPQTHAEWRAQMQCWERKFGHGWYQHNAQLAWQFWRAKRPWWL